MSCKSLSYEDVCIKIAESYKDAGKLAEISDYLVLYHDEYTESEVKHFLEMFGLAFDDLKKRENQKLKIKTMQYKNVDYKPEIHERKKALTVKNPYAEWIAQGKKKIEVRSRNTSHRGELVICSSKSPEIQEMMSGCMLAIVDLYKTVPLENLTDEEWKLTCIPDEQKEELIGQKHYGWFLKDVVRIVEYPVSGNLGIWNLVVDKMEIVPYSSSEIKSIEVNKKKVPKYDRKAVIKGTIVLIVIFVLMILAIWGITSFLINLFN